MINSGAKLSIQNERSNCCGNYCHIHYKYNMHEDVSASAIGRVWHVGVTNKSISDMSVLSDMREIRNGLKTCNICLAMMMLTNLLLILNIVQLPFLMCKIKILFI